MADRALNHADVARLVLNGIRGPLERLGERIAEDRRTMALLQERLERAERRVAKLTTQLQEASSDVSA